MTTTKEGNFFQRMHPLQRVLLSLLLSGIVWALTRNSGLNPLLEAMILWDVFALAFIGSSIVVFFACRVMQIRQVARKEDGSKTFVFLMILVSSFVSMLTVLLLVISKDKQITNQFIYLPAAIGGMLLSWAIVHLTFAFHYAHLYYRDHEEDPKQHAGGLDFPGEEKPGYSDFAYFAFVIGMTFQVSDVSITSKRLRRLALTHGLLSFILNTFVVALTINIVAGLSK